MSPSQKSDAHTITTHDATTLFEEFGVPRSQRSIERYCRRGDLDCWVDPDLQVYYITRESITRLAGHFKEIDARKSGGALQQGTAADADRQGAPAGGTPASSQHAAADEQELARLRRELEDLHRANRDLEINSRAKDQMLEGAHQEIERHVEERKYLIGRIEDANRLLGSAEAQLRALQAPDGSQRHDAPGRADTDRS